MNHLSFRVLIADEHPAVCVGVQHALSRYTTVEIACASRGIGSIQQALEATTYDVLVCEYYVLTGLYKDAIPCPDTIRQRYPGLSIVILTHLESASVVHTLLTRSLQCIVSKFDELSHLMPAILRARSDDRYLSPRIEALAQTVTYGKTGPMALTLRELEVIRLFVAGITVKEIASRLGRSKQTISAQKGTAMLKLGLQSDIELLRYGIRMGLIDA